MSSINKTDIDKGKTRVIKFLTEQAAAALMECFYWSFVNHGAEKGQKR